MGLNFSSVLNDSFKDFKNSFMKFILLGLFLYFIPGIIQVAFTLAFGFTSPAMILQQPKWVWAAAVLIMLVMSVLYTILSISLLLILKNNKLSVTDAIKGSMKYFWKSILFGIVVFFLMVLLFMLLIIPGIIFMIYWLFSFYFLILEDCGIGESLDESKKIVKGRWWKVFGYSLLIFIILGAFSGMINFAFSAPAMFSVGFEQMATSGNDWILLNPVLGSISMVGSLIIGVLVFIFQMVWGYNFYMALKKNLLRK